MEYIVICSVFSPAVLYLSNTIESRYVWKHSIRWSWICGSILCAGISLALYSLQDTWQITPALFLQANWLIEIVRTMT